MKLAEALAQRADLVRKGASLQQRVQANLIVQEGDEPQEDPNALIVELEEAYDRLRWIIKAINHTNNVTVVNGQPISQLIVERESLKARSAMYRAIAQGLGQNRLRMGRAEIKFINVLAPKPLLDKADELAAEYRELDALIQSTNWSTDLEEPQYG